MKASLGWVRTVWFACGLALCAIFLYGCLMPNPPSAPGIPHFDKFEHAFAFVVMGAWFGALFRRAPVRVLVALSLFGAATEVLQWASGYRCGDPLDWGADTAGVVIGLALVRFTGVDWVARVERRVAAAAGN